VSAAMAAVAGRRTTILIAHRLQTARTADRIVVLARVAWWSRALIRSWWPATAVRRDVARVRARLRVLTSPDGKTFVVAQIHGSLCRPAAGFGYRRYPGAAG